MFKHLIILTLILLNIFPSSIVVALENNISNSKVQASPYALTCEEIRNFFEGKGKEETLVEIKSWGTTCSQKYVDKTLNDKIIIITKPTPPVSPERDCKDTDLGTICSTSKQPDSPQNTDEEKKTVRDPTFNIVRKNTQEKTGKRQIKKKTIFQSWWFWTIAGGAIIAAATCCKTPPEPGSGGTNTVVINW